MNKKNIMQILVLIFFLVIIAGNVLALGMSPARALYRYEDGDASGKIKILNNQNRDMKLVIFAEGEYKDSIKLSEQLITLTPDQASKEVEYKVIMPKKPKPGRQEIDITILELQSEDKDDNFIATNSIASKVLIDVPYPGKYVQSKLHINPANSGETTSFAVSLFGRGKKNIDNVKATIIVKGPTNEEITRLQSDTISLASGKDKKLVVNWEANVNPGLYYAEAIVTFDGEQITLRETFMIGDKNLRIKDLIIDKFVLGQIAKVDVIAESVWNKEIKDVYAEIGVLDRSGIELENIKTSTINIPSMGTATLSGYWDTEGMSIGDYDLNVKLIYEEKLTEKLFEAVINANNIQITDTATLSGQIIGGEEGGGSTIIILIIAVIILIIINLTWLFYFKKFRKKK